MCPPWVVYMPCTHAMLRQARSGQPSVRRAAAHEGAALSVTPAGRPAVWRGVGRRAAPRTAGHPSRGRDTCGSEGQPPAAEALVRWPPEGPAARILLPPVPLVVQAPARRGCHRPITARAPHGARGPAAASPVPRRAGPARASAAAACAPSCHQARGRRRRCRRRRRRHRLQRQRR